MLDIQLVSQYPWIKNNKKWLPYSPKGNEIRWALKDIFPVLSHFLPCTVATVILWFADSIKVTILFRDCNLIQLLPQWLSHFKPSLTMWSKVWCKKTDTHLLLYTVANVYPFFLHQTLLIDQARRPSTMAKNRQFFILNLWVNNPVMSNSTHHCDR